MHTIMVGIPSLDREGKKSVFFFIYCRDVFGLNVPSQARKETRRSPGNDSSAHNQHPAVICTTTPPSTAAFTRPGGNIVAKFVFINV